MWVGADGPPWVRKSDSNGARLLMIFTLLSYGLSVSPQNFVFFPRRQKRMSRVCLLFSAAHLGRVFESLQVYIGTLWKRPPNDAMTHHYDIEFFSDACPNPQPSVQFPAVGKPTDQKIRQKAETAL